MNERLLRPLRVGVGIGVFTIDRAEKRNAMTYAMLGEFIRLVGGAHTQMLPTDADYALLAKGRPDLLGPAPADTNQ